MLGIATNKTVAKSVRQSGLLSAVNMIMKSNQETVKGDRCLTEAHGLRITSVTQLPSL